MSDYRYKAFISYSHAADGKLAPAVQSAIQQFAKPWFRLRNFRVFRDKTSLSATPGLWPTIVKALSQSEWFLLMASPQAAASEWVNREIAWWLENRSSDRILVLLTDGELAWDANAQRFDAGRSPDGILLWSVEAQSAIGVFENSAGFEVKLAFSPDGSRLASGTDDGIVRLWDVSSRRALGPPLTESNRSGGSGTIAVVRPPGHAARLRGHRPGHGRHGLQPRRPLAGHGGGNLRAG